MINEGEKMPQADLEEQINPSNHQEEADQDFNQTSEKSIIYKIILDKFNNLGVSEMDLYSAGFQNLEEYQQQLVFRNYNQLALADVEERAQERYENDLRGRKFLGRSWKGMLKNYYVTKEKQNVAQNLAGQEDEQEKINKINKLDFLVGKAKNSSLEVNFNLPNVTTEEQRIIIDFNLAAEEFSVTPYEWSLSTASKEQQKIYNDTKNKYSDFKRELITTIEKRQSEDSDKFLLQFSVLENEIKLNQFLNTHPESEEQLEKIKSAKVWKQFLANSFTEKAGYATLGFATRSITMGMLGAIGAPIAAAAMGGWLGRMRAGKSLKEREISTRKGTVVNAKADKLWLKIKELDRLIYEEKDEAEKSEEEQEQLIFKRDESERGELKKERDKLNYQREKILLKDKNFVKAENLSDKLEMLINQLDFASQDNQEAQENKEDSLKLLNSLSLRVEYTKAKLEDGLVNFGKSEDRIFNQQNLINQLNSAANVLALHDHEFKEDSYYNRLTSLLDLHEAKISKSRRRYLNQQMIKGATLGAAFASVGYAVRHFLFHQDITQAVEQMNQTADETAKIINQEPPVVSTESPPVVDLKTAQPVMTVHLDSQSPIIAGTPAAEQAINTLEENFGDILPEDLEFKGMVPKGSSISEVLNLRIPENSTVTVVNPGGQIIENFDADLVHPGDTILQNKAGDIWVVKSSGVSVREGMNYVPGKGLVNEPSISSAENLAPQEVSEPVEVPGPEEVSVPTEVVQSVKETFPIKTSVTKVNIAPDTNSLIKDVKADTVSYEQFKEIVSPKSDFPLSPELENNLHDLFDSVKSDTLSPQQNRTLEVLLARNSANTDTIKTIADSTQEAPISIDSTDVIKESPKIVQPTIEEFEVSDSSDIEDTHEFVNTNSLIKDVKADTVSYEQFKEIVSPKSDFPLSPELENNLHDLFDSVKSDTLSPQQNRTLEVLLARNSANTDTIKTIADSTQEAPISIDSTDVIKESLESVKPSVEESGFISDAIKPEEKVIEFLQSDRYAKASPENKVSLLMDLVERKGDQILKTPKGQQVRLFILRGDGFKSLESHIEGQNAFSNIGGVEVKETTTLSEDNIENFEYFIKTGEYKTMSVESANSVETGTAGINEASVNEAIDFGPENKENWLMLDKFVNLNGKEQLAVLERVTPPYSKDNFKVIPLSRPGQDGVQVFHDPDGNLSFRLASRNDNGDLVPYMRDKVTGQISNKKSVSFILDKGNVTVLKAALEDWE